jgi:hypothetical protein
MPLCFLLSWMPCPQAIWQYSMGIAFPDIRGPSFAFHVVYHHFFFAFVTMGTEWLAVRKCDLRGTVGGFRVVARSARADRARLGCEPCTIRGWHLLINAERAGVGSHIMPVLSATHLILFTLFALCIAATSSSPRHICHMHRPWQMAYTSLRMVSLPV